MGHIDTACEMDGPTDRQSETNIHPHQYTPPPPPNFVVYNYATN